MTATDSMLARYQGESEEQAELMDNLVAKAEADGRDLDDKEMELLTRSRDRIKALSGLIEPLKDAQALTRQSRDRTAELAALASAAAPDAMQYRSAGAYVLDYWQAKTGVDSARQRMEVWHRAASHQTTADNPGLLPEQILGPVVNFIDTARPTVGVLGARALPAGTWMRPSITQHTQVGTQSAEKQELASRKMTIAKVPVTAVTLGGYVNVSRQDIDWTQPQIMDLVINDLAAQYAIATEAKAVADIVAGATVGPTLPTGAKTAQQITAAYWIAAGSIYNATKGIGSVFAVTGPDMLGVLGPVFPPINPMNAYGQGFNAGNFQQGLVGSVAGIPTYVSAAMPANNIIVMSAAAAEVYEDRVGALQVIEPSVLGVQVAYAGYFADLILLAAGIVKIVSTP